MSDIVPVEKHEVEVREGPKVGVLLPIGTGQDLKDAMNAYQATCKAILDNDDYQGIGKKKFKKKSAWRKLALAYGVSFKMSEKIIIYDENGKIVRAEFVHEAVAPNGRSSTGWGCCSTNERNFNKPEHDIPAVAETRSKNRACADLFGLGETSAEEMSASGDTHEGEQWDKAVTDLTTKDGCKRHFWATLNENFGDVAPWEKDNEDATAKMDVIQRTFGTRSVKSIKNLPEDQYVAAVNANLEGALKSVLDARAMKEKVQKTKDEVVEKMGAPDDDAEVF